MDVFQYIYIYIYIFFFDNAPFEKSLNATFISLIPKISGVVKVRGFRPISLVIRKLRSFNQALLENGFRDLGMSSKPSG